MEKHVPHLPPLWGRSAWNRECDSTTGGGRSDATRSFRDSQDSNAEASTPLVSAPHPPQHRVRDVAATSPTEGGGEAATYTRKFAPHLAVCLIAATILAGLAAGRGTQPVRAAAAPYGVDPQPGFAPMSAASCSASACHGGQAGKFGGEHTAWAPEVNPHGEHDPHSKAYRVLFNADSVHIAKLLGGGPAHKNSLCLNCHSPAGGAEGVGCSACHGSGEKWLDVHYLPEWKAKSNRDKWTEYGFVPTKNLTARISNCATCHVGSADREVNHDLIAAGHPRLAFEYTRFHFSGTYRKHWEERTPQPDFEVRAWLIGQAATARAAVDVLHARAVNAKANKAPWPEFAGYSCFACHQNVGDRDPKGTLGLPGWEVWHTATLDAAATRSHTLFTGVKQPALVQFEALKKLMAQANPKPAQVEAASAAARAELDAWLADLQAAEDANPRSPNAGTHAADATFFLTMSAGKSEDWDALAAHYLGVAAMFHATGGAKAHPLTKGPLTAIRGDLRFPKSFNNPAGFDRVKFNRVRGEFQNLLNAAIEERSR